jgi:hypothetical protein
MDFNLRKSSGTLGDISDDDGIVGFFGSKGVVVRLKRVASNGVWVSTFVNGDCVAEVRGC